MHAICVADGALVIEPVAQGEDTIYRARVLGGTPDLPTEATGQTQAEAFDTLREIRRTAAKKQMEIQLNELRALAKGETNVVPSWVDRVMNFVERR